MTPVRPTQPASTNAPVRLTIKRPRPVTAEDLIRPLFLEPLFGNLRKKGNQGRNM